jgi:single-stranded-DNA-specific exonuclease
VSETFAAARAWLADQRAGLVLYPHGDPDGLAAGALLAQHTGAPAVFADPFTEPPRSSGPVAIIDQGVRPVDTDGPLLFVDHHAAPEPVDGALVVWDLDAGSTSLLAWRLLAEPVDGAWLAGLGLVGDLGERGLRESGLRAGPVAPLRRLATLCSAAGRLRDGPLEAAFTALRESAGAAEALGHPGARELEAARERVEGLRKAAARTAPRVGPAAALIELDVPARVHSQVASAWSRRLAPRPVVVSNRGWRPNRVSFAERSADGRDLRAWLREIYEPPPGSGDYGRGHARATGGSLVPEAYERFAETVLTTPA